MNTERVRQACLDDARQLPERVSDLVHRHARQRPEAVALIEHDTGERIRWRKFRQAMDAFSAKLLAMGLRRGDVIATSLPFLKEHVFLEYACFQIGVLIAPLDLRLKGEEILAAFEQIRPRAYFFLGQTPKVDFRPQVARIMQATPSGCAHWIQFQADHEGVLPGARHVQDFASDIKVRYLLSLLSGTLRRARHKVQRKDPALIIFTTGSTGRPKPALIGHENIMLQNIGLARGFGLRSEDKMLVNLPPSHVGGQTEQLMTSIYGGGTAVLLHIFDARKSLEAIERHGVTACGQIPALFNMEWRLEDYENFDLSSLRMAIYGGQSVDGNFLQGLSEMAPEMGTGLGLTETAGFCTFTPRSWGTEEIADSIGFDSPLCPISIRKPMRQDGTAGEELPAGAVGEICFFGEQVFSGYLNDPVSTAKTLSKDGFCYTGDRGHYDERGLHFAGRSKFVIKPKGYQVHPAEVEDHLARGFPDRIQSVGCVGVPHQVFSEGIVAFIECKAQQKVSREELENRAKGLASYKRPGHYVFIEPGEMPLNRVAKTDTLVLQGRAMEEVERLRQEGAWDAG